MSEQSGDAIHRRQFLAMSGSAVSVGIAGCVGTAVVKTNDEAFNVSVVALPACAGEAKVEVTVSEPVARQADYVIAVGEDGQQQGIDALGYGETTARFVSVPCGTYDVIAVSGGDRACDSCSLTGGEEVARTTVEVSV